ncbi:MAG: sulfotransferase family 2 domain-containing protein [Anaerolineae bacterium]
MSRTPGAPPPVVVFLHIPKAAGTTLHHILERQYPPEAVFSISDQVALDAFRQLPEARRAQLRCVKGHFPFGVHQWLPGDATYITLLREPVSRVVSDYYYIRSHPEHPYHATLVAERLTLEDFAHIHIEAGEANLQTRWISGMVDMDHVTPPYGPLPAGALERARATLRSAFSVFGAVEQFDAALLLMKHAFGWGNVFYTRKNVTGAQTDPTAIPPSVAEMLAHANQLDGELYAFARAELAAQIAARGVAFAAELRAFRALNRLYGDIWRRYALPTRIAQGRRAIASLPARIAGKGDAQ